MSRGPETSSRDEIPSFDEAPHDRDHGPIDWTAFTSVRTAKSALEIGTIIAIAVVVFFGARGDPAVDERPRVRHPAADHRRQGARRRTSA